jgi:hypothetical protein
MPPAKPRVMNESGTRIKPYNQTLKWKLMASLALSLHHRIVRDKQNGDRIAIEITKPLRKIDP